MKLLKKFQQIDVFREIPNEITQTSTTGAFVSLVCISVMLLLIIAELFTFMTVQTNSSMYVQMPGALTNSNEQLRINVDLDFFSISCDLLSLDAQDVMGTHTMDVAGTIEKHSFVKDKVTGCNIRGYLEVNKVPGNFHISTHSHLQKLSELMMKGDKLDLGHRVNHLSFGTPLSVRDTDVAYSPLDSLERRSDEIYTNKIITNSVMILKHSGSYEYYLKVVPTIHKKLDGHETNSYQFSSSNMHFGDTKFPAVFFRYELSPITVEYTESRKALTTFLINLLGIVGGVFTGFSLVSTWLNLSLARIIRKANANKLG